MTDTAEESFLKVKKKLPTNKNKKPMNTKFQGAMDSLQKDNELFANIKSHLPEFEALLQEMNSHWFYEDERE